MRPLPHEVLQMVAVALRETVLPDVASGPARRQLRAAIGIIERTAGAIPLLNDHLRDDIDDVATTLARLQLRDTNTADLAVPSLDRLITEQEALHAELATICETLDDDITAEIGALLARMVRRELSLGLSPWRLEPETAP